MALGVTIPDPQDVGVELDSAYCRIVAFNADFTPGQEKAMIVLDIYRSKAAREAGKPSVARIQVPMPVEPVAEVLEGETVVQPAIQSFSEAIVANAAAYNSLRTALYEYAKENSAPLKAADPQDIIES